LDIQEVSSFTDFFVLCSASSNRMLDALAEEVMKSAKSIINWQGSIEGQPNDGWLVIDLGDVVVHLFIPEQRKYYNLEQLWNKGKVILHLQ